VIAFTTAVAEKVGEEARLAALWATPMTLGHRAGAPDQRRSRIIAGDLEQ